MSSCCSDNRSEHQSVVQCRELKQKRKRDPASSDQPQRIKRKMAGSDSMPGGVGRDSTAVGASPPSWEHNSSPQLPRDDTNVKPSQKGSSVEQPSHSALVETLHGQAMSHDSHGIESATQGSGGDQLMDKLSSPEDLGSDRLESPDSAEHAQHDIDDLHRMVQHLSGHLPDPADEAAPRAEDEGVTNEEDAFWERKQSSMTDIDVVN